MFSDRNPGRMYCYDVQEDTEQAADAPARRAPPSREAASRALLITGFIRPFTEKQARQKLSETGASLACPPSSPQLPLCCSHSSLSLQIYKVALLLYNNVVLVLQVRSQASG